MSKRVYILCFVVLFSIILADKACADSNLVDTKHHRFGIRYTMLDYHVEKMPLDFRSVPIHPDDGYADEEDWGPIDEKSYDRDHWVSLDYGYLWEINNHWSMGLGVVWIVDFWDQFGDDSRRNYTNHPGTGTRGYGAALTFVATGIRGLLAVEGDGDSWGTFLNFTPQIVAEYAFDKERKTRVGFNVSYHRYVAINGWDRYDKFEIDEIETLAHIYPVTAEMSFKYLTLGLSYNLYSLTDFGEEVDTKIGNLSFSLKLLGVF
jgi:hypothetical protein